MTDQRGKDFYQDLYRVFSRPLSDIDCGEKCGPFNEYGVPVCCDINLIIPSAHEDEWEYLKKETDLWRPWSSSGQAGAEINDEIQDGQVLLQCLGYQHCQRQFRSLTCRSFPFFPYVDSQGRFIGLCYFPEYREQCWIISNLGLVSPEYKAEFREAFEILFQAYPESRSSYSGYCAYFREQMARSGDKIILLDFKDKVFILDPVSEDSRQASFQDLESYGPFSITRDLIFPDENPV